MISVASPANPVPSRDQIADSKTHTRNQSRKSNTQHSPRSSSTSSSHPSTQPSELFEHDMTSPSSSVPVSDGYEEDGVRRKVSRRRMQGSGQRQHLSVDMQGIEDEDELDDDTSRVTVLASTSARPMGGAPVSPVRLAKLANAFGVSTPVPSMSDTQSPHQFGFSTNTLTRSSATRFLIHVIPPASLAVDPSAEAQLKRGALVPLHSTLKGQLGAVAKEYRLPSTIGMVVYLIPDDPESAAMAGPRISDDAWKLLWQPLLRMERDEIVAAVTSPRSASVLSHSPVPSPPTTLNDSPTDDLSIASPSSEARVLRPLNTSSAATVTPSPQRRAFAFPGKPPALEQDGSGRLRQGSIASLRSVASSQASRPSTALSVLQPPIVGKIEFDIERHKAPWFDIWLARLRQRSAAPTPSPSLPSGPLPLQLPSRATSRANSRMGSRAVSRAGSRSPRSPFFRLGGDSALPSPALARGMDGLLSPGNDSLLHEPEPYSVLPDTPFVPHTPQDEPETPEEPEGASYMQLEDDGDGTPEEQANSPHSEYDEVHEDEHEDDPRVSTKQARAIPALSVNSDPLGDVFPTDAQTWTTLRNSSSSQMAQPAHSHRSSLSGVQGLGISMNGVPYSPSVHEHSLEPEEPEEEPELEPPSPARFDEEGNGSGTEWDSTDDVEDVVSLWNAKHSPEEQVTKEQLRHGLRESLRQPITVVEVRRASRETTKPDVEASQTFSLSPEPAHSPSTVTPGDSPTGSAAHSRIPSTATETLPAEPTSPKPPAPKRAIPPTPLRLAPSPMILDRSVEREGAERDSTLSLAYLSKRLQSPSRQSGNRQSSVDSEADSLRASQIRMQRELDDIEKAYAQFSPRTEVTTSFMDLNPSPDLNSASTPVFPGPSTKPPLLVSAWPAVPVSPTVAQQGLDGLMSPGIIGSEDRPFAPATISIETLQRARSAQEEGLDIGSEDKKGRRSTKTPSIMVGHERNDSVMSRDSSRFSDDSPARGDIKTERKRSQAVMSVKSIRRLWKKGAQGALQEVPEADSPPLPSASPRSPIPPPSPRRIDLASPRISTSSSIESASDSKDSKHDSNLDHFRFEQDARLSIRSPTPNMQNASRTPPIPPIPQTDKNASLRSARTRSVLNKWASPKLRSQPAKAEPEEEGGVRINGRSVTISAPMHVIHGQADIRDARFAAAHRAAPSPPQNAPTVSPGTPPTAAGSSAGTQKATPPSRPVRESGTPARPAGSTPPTVKGPGRQNSIRRKPVPGLEEVNEDGVRITHSPASSISRSHRAAPSISASLLSQPLQEEQQPRPSISSSTDDPLSPTELQSFEMVTPAGYAHIRSSPAF